MVSLLQMSPVVGKQADRDRKQLTGFGLTMHQLAIAFGCALNGYIPYGNQKF